MQVKVLKEFTGYPGGKKTLFAKDSKVEVSTSYVDEAKLIKKGLVRKLPAQDK